MKREKMLWPPALFLLVASLSGCQGSVSDLSQEAQESVPDQVKLTVWGAEEDEEIGRAHV